jgi:hypothetical protein
VAPGGKARRAPAPLYRLTPQGCRPAAQRSGWRNFVAAVNRIALLDHA